jgi:hypothetical protein
MIGLGERKVVTDDSKYVSLPVLLIGNPSSIDFAIKKIINTQQSILTIV